MGTWDQVKGAMAEELAVWAKTMEELKITLAIKAHSKLAMNLPERLLWLEDQVRSPRIRVVYDYSHFLANKLDMEKTMRDVASRAVHPPLQFTEEIPMKIKTKVRGGRSCTSGDGHY